MFSKKTLAFTAAWKAFERELINNSIKADLVQLNGYYQNTPNFRCKTIILDEYKFGQVLKSVLEGENVAKIVDTSTLANSWGIDSSQVMDIAEYLKSVGYEIRNNSTNPQIEEGCWLIPYAFPTLTYLSVQLWKKLQ